LNTTPTAENTLRTGPPQAGHSLADGSVKDCTSSNSLPHEVLVQAYW
jgi:hypothetical protein